MAYSDSYFTARESWRDWRIEARQLMDLARVSNGTRVLEVGCGGGGLLRLLSARGAMAVGVDTLETALELARGRDRSGYAAAKQPRKPDRSALVRIGADGALPIRAGAFDAIVAQHVIEHLPDAGAALCEWNRVLKAGGRIALATPNAGYPDPAHFADGDHARVYSVGEVCRVVEKAGLVVESVSTIFPFLSRFRVLRAAGVIAYRVFENLPYFAARGRTILLSARKP
ncbi:MAG: class I SAM-dependent methyltransferase [Chloroflexi bacterium]|nr:class I SAM-dependent methyltransferase [Chloroflexota bacterium]